MIIYFFEFFSFLGKKRRILNLNISYSDNQKTMEQKDYIKANIFTHNLAKHYLSHLDCTFTIVMSNVH